MLPRYFSGKPTDLGNVAALKQTTFLSLCDDIIRQPIKLSLTREALHSLPEDKQNAAKRVRYLTACTFKGNPSPRTKVHAGPCNLVFLDIDKQADALRLLDSHWPTMLKGLNYLVYHTARSTPKHPRLRIVVDADEIPVEQYPLAVAKIGERVGVDPSPESFRAFQPMFLPTSYQHDTVDPIFTFENGQQPFTIRHLAPDETPPESMEAAETAPPPDQTSVTTLDLTHLRTPVEGVTLEDAKGAMDHLDPDCPMQQWIEIGAALKHQFADAGYALWHEWSAKGKKFTNDKDTHYRWTTLKGQTKDRAPVTIRSLFRAARARGWTNDRLAKVAFAATMEWLRTPERATEDLLDNGPDRIARVTPMVGEMQRTTLINALRDRLRGRGMATTVAAIKSDVEKLEIEAEKKTAGVPPWAAGLVFVTAGGFFYRYNVDRRFAPEVIDLMYTAPSLGDKTPPRTSVYLVKTAQIPQVENLRYEPARGDTRVFTVGGVPYVNIYQANYTKPDKHRMEEAGRIVEEHTHNLIKEPEHAETFLDYLTFLVQHPGVKIRWAPVIQSTKGTGKGWYAEMMQVVLGVSNVNVLMPTGIMDNQYNDWAYGHQLLVMNEVRIVGHNRYEVMDKIKPLITDDRVSLNVKYESQRAVDNIQNYLLFTNYHDALAIQDDERRYFVLQSPLQRPEQIAALGGDGYFDRIYAQIKGNPGGLRAYFENRTIGKDFKPDGRAPKTEYMAAMVIAGASPLAAALMQAIEDSEHALIKQDLVSMQALRGVLESTENVGQFTDQAMAHILKEMGWVKGLRCRLKGERHTLWAKGEARDLKTIAEERLEIL